MLSLFVYVVRLLFLFVCLIVSFFSFPQCINDFPQTSFCLLLELYVFLFTVRTVPISVRCQNYTSFCSLLELYVFLFTVRTTRLSVHCQNYTSFCSLLELYVFLFTVRTIRLYVHCQNYASFCSLLELLSHNVEQCMFMYLLPHIIPKSVLSVIQ